MPGKVRNFLTLGSPHMGGAGIPNCLTGAFCDLLFNFAKKYVYDDLVQNWFAPAAYFRDVTDYEDYLKTNFLPQLNNELSYDGSYSNARKDRFRSIN